MASPLFLSYGWSDGSPPPVVEELDRLLQLRGVPMWRDLRDLGAGGLNEEVAGAAIREECCGCILHFTEQILDSWFIGSVELEAVRHRLDRDEDFFLAAVFDGVGKEQIESLEKEASLNLRAFQGLFLDSTKDIGEQLEGFSSQLLRRYLEGIDIEQPTARVDSWGRIPWKDAAPIQLNWAGEDDGDGQLPADWDALKRAVTDLRAALGELTTERVLRLNGTIHLSAAFLIGWEFRETTGWTIEADHPRAGVTVTTMRPDPQGWTITPLPSQNDSGSVIVRVCASADCSHAVRAHLAEMDRARAELAVFPPGGKTGRFSVDDFDLNGLATAIIAAVRSCRERYGVEVTKLYLASPWTLALTLGWNFASSGTLVVYEATADKSTYHPTPLQLP
ncbi:MAG TPA: SAVED domain-containing protein [Solirubrobacterales bacterium]